MQADLPSGDGVGGLAAAGARSDTAGPAASGATGASDVADWFGAAMQKRLAAFARRFVGVDDADDIAQETLLRAGAGLAALRAADRAEAWLFRICRHTAIDHVRARRVRRRFWSPLPDDAAVTVRIEPAAAPSASAARDAILDELIAGLRRLPAHHRLLMTLRYVKGYSGETICRMTGLSEPALRVRLFRARWELVSSRPGGGASARGRRAGGSPLVPEPP